MVKVIWRSVTASWRGTMSWYLCEVCGKRFKEREDAEKCEGSHTTIEAFIPGAFPT